MPPNEPLDLEELERLVKAMSPTPWTISASFVGDVMRKFLIRPGLDRLCPGVLFGMGVKTEAQHDADAVGSAALRNAFPRLLAIARAAEEAAELQLGCSAHFTAFLEAMNRLRAAVNARASAAPKATVALATERKTDA